MERGEVFHSEAPEPELVLSVEGVSKAFEGTVALEDAGVEVRSGEVHALVGGNGSGKSTLLKIMAGVMEADSGVIETGGRSRPIEGFGASDAKDSGLLFVHQQPTLFDELSVVENLAIGRGYEMARLGRISWRRTRRHTREVLDKYGIDVPLNKPVGELSPAMKSIIAILRAFQESDSREDAVLALDEPTATLPPSEVEWLLEMMRRCAGEGRAVLFVSHRLDEVLAIADRVTVLRDGKVVGTVPGAGLTKEKLAELIVGRPIESYYQEPAVRSGATPIFTAEELGGGRVQGVSLDAAAGEIVGIAGLAGSGRSTLLRLIYGSQPRSSGKMQLDSEDFSPRLPHSSIRSGVAYVSEDRMRDSLLPDLAIRENVCVVDPAEYWNGAWIRRSEERAAAQSAISEFGVRAASQNVPIATLSGGNQQKVALARWLRRDPRLLLLDEPTQGVDVGARAELWDLMRKAAEQGAAIITVSSDFEELVHLCGRLIVLRAGRKVAEISTAGLSPEEVNMMLHDLEVAA